jgi:hypothetical protein
MELNLEGLVGITGQPSTDTHNLVMGHDGLYYEPSSIVRMCQLVDNSSGRQIQNLNYVNVIDNALKYWAKGSNEMTSDALWNGAGHKGENDKILSIFNNQYPDENPTLKVPLSSVLPGTLGESDALPSGSDLTLRLLLEPQYNLFMRAVPSQKFSKGTITNSITAYAFNNLNANLTTLQASATGTIQNFKEGDFLAITGIISGGVGPDIFFKQITDLTPDNGSTAGYFEIDSPLSTAQPVTNIFAQVVKKSYVLGCQGVSDTTNTFKLDFPYSIDKSDISVGTVCKVYYNELIGPLQSAQKSAQVKITNLTITAGAITAIQFDASFISPSQGGLTNIYVVPLYTNLTAKWSVVNSHVVVYRHNMKVKTPQKMLISAFESSGVQCTQGLQRFVYNFKIDNNAFNTWVITPSQTNLYPQVQTFDSYLFTVDETPLSSIYINTPESAVHIDNLSKCLQNSPVYKPKNLDRNRDKEIEHDTVILPSLFPGKVRASELKGEPFVQPEGVDRNLRVELTSTAGTPLTTVFMFQEMWKNV